MAKSIKLCNDLAFEVNTFSNDLSGNLIKNNAYVGRIENFKLFHENKDYSSLFYIEVNNEYRNQNIGKNAIKGLINFSKNYDSKGLQIMYVQSGKFFDKILTEFKNEGLIKDFDMDYFVNY